MTYLSVEMMLQINSLSTCRAGHNPKSRFNTHYLVLVIFSSFKPSGSFSALTDLDSSYFCLG